jgi:hypothetical protein
LSVKIPNDVWTPVTVADDPYSKKLFSAGILRVRIVGMPDNGVGCHLFHLPLGLGVRGVTTVTADPYQLAAKNREELQK